MSRPAPRRGLYEDAFWAWIDGDELRLQRCAVCARLRYPPSPVCPHCLCDDATWDSVAGGAVIVSWTRFHRAYFPDVPTPYICVSVLLDEGVLMIGNFVGCDRDPRIGQRVRLAFERVSAGTIGRLPQWTPEPPQSA